MSVQLNARVLMLVSLLLSACADESEPEAPTTPGLGGITGQYDTGVLPGAGDAGALHSLDAGGSPGIWDAGAPPSGWDASAVLPGVDAGWPSFDAGNPFPHDGGSTVDAGASDAGHSNDAGSNADSGSGSTCDTLTYASFGQQFMTMYCTGCHSGFGQKPALNALASIQTNNAAIKQHAVTGTLFGPDMPQFGSPQPTDAERQKLGQWLDCGPK